MYSWPLQLTQIHFPKNLQILPTTHAQQQDPLRFYELVPLGQMQIYNESNPEVSIRKGKADIMTDFSEYLKNNKYKISELSTSNIEVSYKTDFTLSFNFEPSNPQNQDAVTFINAKNEE